MMIPSCRVKTCSMDSLPVELLEDIARKIDKIQDLANFRLTSRRINAVAEPILFESVEIAIQGQELSRRSVLLLDTIFTGRIDSRPTSQRLCLLVRRLKIQSLNTPPKPRQSLTVLPHDYPTDTLEPGCCGTNWASSLTRFPTYKQRRLVRSEGRGCVNMSAKNSRERTLEEWLDVIRTFTNTDSVTWHVWSRSADLQVYNDHLFKVLASLPSLSSFTVSVLGLTPIHIPDINLGGLRTLRIQCSMSSREETQRSILDPLVSVISNCPDLEELHLDFRMNYLGEAVPAELGDFFNKISVSTSGDAARARRPLPIKRLILRGWNMDLSEDAAIHLRRLSKVKIMDPCPVQSNFWQVLESEGIHLREVSVKALSRSVLDYLDSYSGLEVLEVYPSFMRDVDGQFNYDEHPHMAPRFYGVVQKHAETIRKLFIRGCSRGTWCLGEENIGYLRGCRKLEELAVCVDPRAIGPAGSELDVLTLIMDMIAQLPCLRILQLYISKTRLLGCSVCGGDLKYQSPELTTAQIEERIRSIQPPIEYLRTLNVLVEDRVVVWGGVTQ